MKIYFKPAFVCVFVVILCGFTLKSEKGLIVKASDLKEWIDYLSSDKMRGRANGSAEMKTAAGWVTEKFKEYGLKPVLPDSEYIQNYSFSARQSIVNERNVIGMIEGTDAMLKDQYIILSAHFDHVGVRKTADTDSIFNGADDNASGTCTLLGIAKTIKESGFKPGRTIIFAVFSGEESGMRGSRYFTSKSPISLNKVFVNLNFEMTGHSEYLGKNRYYMTGCKVSNLDDLIIKYNQKSDWILIDTIPLAENLFYASDNIALSRISSANGLSQGIPSGTFATTALAEYIHTPHDEGDLFDYENMAGLVDYFSNLVIWLSGNKTDVEFADPAFTRIK
jgi:Zn-dependent M28 family amino/carboxypeptidase